MPAGRPSVYGEEKLSLAREYLESWKTLGDAVPQVAGLSAHMGISRETVYAWSREEEKQEFSDILTKIMAAQERELMNKGLTGDFNSAFAKMAMTKHGYTEKLENTIQGPGGGAVEIKAWEILPVAGGQKPTN